MYHRRPSCSSRIDNDSGLRRRTGAAGLLHVSYLPGRLIRVCVCGSVIVQSTCPLFDWCPFSWIIRCWRARAQRTDSLCGWPADEVLRGLTPIMDQNCRPSGPMWVTLVALLATGVGCSTTHRQEFAPIHPVGLIPGDTIAFVAPAGKLDRQRMDLARQRLRAMGFRVQVPDDLYRSRGYLAGPDETRAEELMAAFRDPNVKAIFPGTGSYGATRILDRLDYDVIRKNPKIIIGFSDITGLHLAIQKKTGLVTFHSPNPMWGLGSEGNLRDFSARYFWRALLQRGPLDSGGQGSTGGYTIVTPQGVPQVRAISPGVGRGRLTGGNLSLIIALMGTEFEIETDGRILFLEDVGERPYRIDRYLCQLRLAGKLDNLAGVILGQFADCEPKKGKASLSLSQVLGDYFDDLGVPVVVNFPAGHSAYNATLPLGALVEVNADTGSVSVLEEPVRHADAS